MQACKQAAANLEGWGQARTQSTDINNPEATPQPYRVEVDAGAHVNCRTKVNDLDLRPGIIRGRSQVQIQLR